MRVRPDKTSPLPQPRLQMNRDQEAVCPNESCFVQASFIATDASLCLEQRKGISVAPGEFGSVTVASVTVYVAPALEQSS